MAGSAPVGADSIMRLVHRRPVHVDLDMTLRECARVMTDESIGAVLLSNETRHLAVLREDETVGVISSRDVLAVLAAGRQAH